MLRTLGRALVAGFLILLPALLAYVLLGGFYDLVVLLTTPLDDLIPRWGLLAPWVRQLASIGVLCIIFIAVGALGHTATARRLGASIDDWIGSVFPPYRVLRNITHQLKGDTAKNMRGVVVPLGPDVRTLGFVVEELPNGLATVFIPMTSLPTMGQLQVRPVETLEPVDASFIDAMAWYFDWGMGTEALFKSPPSTDGSERTAD